jgi:hypothetical protein
VVWEGGGQCSQRLSGGWQRRPCPPGGDAGPRLLAELRRHLGGAAAGPGVPASGALDGSMDETPPGTLPADLRRSLRALGYL